MRLRRFENIEDFCQRVEPFLLKHEAEHNLILGWCSNLIQQPNDYQNPYLAVIEKNKVVQAALLMTPPYYAAISLTNYPGTLPLFAQDMYKDFQTLPGISGSPELCRIFAKEWRKTSGQPSHEVMFQHLYQLDKVNSVRNVTGHLRRATEADYPLLLEWMIAFEKEASGDAAPDEVYIEKMVRMMLTSPVRGAYFWVDQNPVSFAAYGGLTPNSARIGPVYTPPEYRGHGYATACVAALSQYLLDSGRKFVTLFTDFSNPTANHIYQVIGYNSVMDFSMLKFEQLE